MPMDSIEVAASQSSKRRRKASRPTIGMLNSTLVDLHQMQWLGTVDGARAHGADLVCFVGRELGHPEGYNAQANAIYDLVDEEQLDGLIIWMTTMQVFAGQQKGEQFCRRFDSMPIISVEEVLHGSPSLLMDNRQGMFDAVSHLIESHGSRRIAFIRGPANHSGAQRRYQGYLDALAAHGLPFEPALAPRVRSWGPVEAAATALQLLVAGPRGGIDAIAAANDDLALGVLTTLEDLNLRAPDDIAVVGFGDQMNVIHHDLGLESTTADAADAILARAINLSAATLPLTTVGVPFYELGRRSVDLLLQRLRGEPVPDVVTVPTELVVRRSCGCFSSSVRQPAPVAMRHMPSRGVMAGHFDEAIEAGRGQIAAEMKGALVRSAAALPADWADRLETAFVEHLRGESSDTFLAVLDELVRTSIRVGETLESWWRALFALRRQAALHLPPGELSPEAEDLWLRVQMLMEETAARLSGYRHLVAEKRDRIVREVGQRLLTAPDVDELADALAEELPKLGIPSCYLAAYTAEPRGEDGNGEGKQPTGVSRAWSRALLAYEHGKRRELPARGEIFPSHELVPGQVLDRTSQYSMVAAPLYFKEEQLGFVLFEVGPRIGWIYEALQEQLSSALQAALLVERERHALAAVARAHDELEERVASRTVELAQANEVLTEQIIERERAEAKQARLEAQLRQGQKMEAVGRLAGGIAHDFNNMLVVINGYSELLLGRVDADDPVRQDLEQIRQAGERAADLTRRLLAFSRQQVLQPSVLNLNDVISNVEAMLEPLIGEDVELTTILAPSLSPVRADAGQIEQLLLNLAVNARDAMPEGGRLTIETANVYLDQDYVREHIGVEAGPHVLLRVSDTGIGMDADTQARLFEPFFTTKPAGRGTGLGLATVFGIVQQTGGHIAVYSAPARGATFEIYLPQSAQRTGETTETALAPSSLRGSETILLVEDEPAVRRASRRFLEEHGYNVLEAVDGGDALRLCERHEGPLHLVITDVVMPGMSGRELGERVARIRPETPVLYVSGYVDTALVRAGLPETAVPLLQKPFSAESLARKVRELLDPPGTR
jgi:signal transduction histidine kinase/DNA-binding LacI/PurR family transcriptional regulator